MGETKKKPTRALAIPVPGPGRKSLYREQFADMARKLCLLGATDEELAAFFEVNTATIYRWQNEHPAFCEAIRAGKVQADANVADSLYKLATGHHVQAEKVVRKAGGEFEAVRYQQYIPGDASAAYRWLLNRRRQNWSDASKVEFSGSITVNHREAARQEVEDLFGPTDIEIIPNG